MATLGAEVGANFIGYTAARLQARLEDLTDEEYLWQPVADG
jgi:hypothetical protein